MPSLGKSQQAALWADMPNAKAIGWYLNEWLAALQVSQADLARMTSWSKGKVSMLCSGKMGYSREVIEGAANALGLHPFELFVHPSRAALIRKSG